jgi:hypothetical protein
LFVDIASDAQAEQVWNQYRQVLQASLQAPPFSAMLSSNSRKRMCLQQKVSNNNGCQLADYCVVYNMATSDIKGPSVKAMYVDVELGLEVKRNCSDDTPYRAPSRELVDNYKSDLRRVVNNAVSSACTQLGHKLSSHVSIDSVCDLGSGR